MVTLDMCLSMCASVCESFLNPFISAMHGIIIMKLVITHYQVLLVTMTIFSVMVSKVNVRQ